MRWKHLFDLPRYISDLEITIISLKNSRNVQRDITDKLKDQFRLMQDEINLLKKSVTTMPIKNDIEMEEPEEIDLVADQNYRIPMMKGISMQFEGEEKSIPLDIYGPEIAKQKTN